MTEAITTNEIAPEVIRGWVHLLTDCELAAALCLEPSTLATWRRAGGGPEPTHIGKSVFYRLDHVREWISAGAMTANYWQEQDAA